MIKRLALIATCFTLVVICLGAYTRLVDAGLGCPDWPGCYGHIVVPSMSAVVKRINATFPSTPLVATKAWAEMVHRYFAGTLGMLMVAISVMGMMLSYKQGKRGRLVAYALLLVLLGYQVTLGMLTVTWKLLPVIVTQHLLGGMLILTSLWFVHLMTRRYQPVAPQSFATKIRPLALVAFLLLFCQILLGAWTSTNYASLCCPDFPFCHASHPFAPWDLKDAFDLFHPVGINYQGGVLAQNVRQTIQMVHRTGALVVGLVFFILAAWINVKAGQDKVLKRASIVMLCALLWQIGLGISNVIFKLPIGVAVLHSVSAGLLLLTVIYLNVVCYRRFER